MDACAVGVAEIPISTERDTVELRRCWVRSRKKEREGKKQIRS